MEKLIFIAIVLMKREIDEKKFNLYYYCINFGFK